MTWPRPTHWSTLRWTPRFDYGGTSLLLDWPQMEFLPDDEGIGGSDISAGRYAAAFRIRLDHRMKLRLRVFGYELAAYRAWFHWAQQHPNIAYQFWFDQHEVATRFDVFMCDPMLGQGKFNVEQEGFPGLYIHEHTIMTLDGSDFDLDYWAALVTE